MSKKRLYEQFKPKHYKLLLILDRDAMTFSGKVTVNGLKSGRPSQRITLHQKDLKITSAFITSHDKNDMHDINVSRINLQKSFDEVRLHTEQLMRSGEYTINLEFNGSITKAMQGIYPSYFTLKNKQKFIISTQFESDHAREAFPCIDEPEAKATFDLTLTTQKDDVVLSNMEPIKQSQSNQTQTVHFDTTPKMSTYLLAFAAGPMHSFEAKTKDGVLVRSWSSIARPKKELEYSVKEAVKILEFYTDYFGMPYPLPKCDQIALPDFDAGAMENWGMVTYREIAMLTDPDNRSISNEQYVSLVIAHELAHQWFGNLVTMKWWDDLWLNESFASLMEHLCLNELHPDWKQWEIFNSSDVLAATNRDIYKDIQPVGVKVTDPDLIETLFDPGIVYAKGARLLKMLREYIGDEAFKNGLRTYFKKHAYSNTTREDLWSVLSASSGQNIHNLMTPWLTQPGMPLVSINQSDDTLKITQKRYVLDADKDTQLWPIPLLANPELEIQLFSNQSAQLKVLPHYVVLNQHASGHFFTKYENPKHLSYLADQFKAQTIPSETRMNLLNDAIMLARKGETSLVDALQLAVSSPTEPRDSVWSLIARVISYAQILTEGDEQTYNAIKAIKVKLAHGWHQKLGWDSKPNEDPNIQQLRHSVLAFMLSGEDKDAVSQGLQRYSTSKLKDLDAELRSSILACAVKNGPSSVVDDLISAYKEVGSDIQLDICSALTSTKNSKVSKKLITQAFGSSGFVRPQDLTRWVVFLLRNRYTRNSMWQYIVDNWIWFEETLGQSKSFDYLPTYAASAMNSKEWEKKYHKLFEPKLTNKLLKQNITIGFSDIASRVAWRERDEIAIKKFFRDQI